PIQHALRRSRLRDDDADVVRNHVVELTGDDPTLLRHGLLCRLLAFPLESGGAILEGRYLTPLGPQAVADEPDRADDQAFGEDGVEFERLPRAEQDHEHDEGAPEGGGDRDL